MKKIINWLFRKKPTLIINFKTYKQGKEVIRLVKKIEKAALGDKWNIIIGVPASEIFNLSKKTKLKVFTEHVDYYEPGKFTGFIIPEAVKSQGAEGTFLNHSEHPLSFKVLKKTIERCKKINLKTAVFAKNLQEAKKIEKLKPDYLIYELPELVGGEVSVSKAKPEIIEKIAKKLKIKFLVGAGIKTHRDVIIAMELGASGIAVSSGVVKARNPEKKLKSLIG